MLSASLAYRTGIAIAALALAAAWRVRRLERLDVHAVQAMAERVRVLEAQQRSGRDDDRDGRRTPAAYADEDRRAWRRGRSADGSDADLFGNVRK